jgi:hypothetical protein
VFECSLKRNVKGNLKHNLKGHLIRQFKDVI